MRSSVCWPFLRSVGPEEGASTLRQWYRQTNARTEPALHREIEIRSHPCTLNICVSMSYSSEVFDGCQTSCMKKQCCLKKMTTWQGKRYLTCAPYFMRLATHCVVLPSKKTWTESRDLRLSWKKVQQNFPLINFQNIVKKTFLNLSATALFILEVSALISEGFCP